MIFKDFKQEKLKNYILFDHILIYKQKIVFKILDRQILLKGKNNRKRRID